MTTMDVIEFLGALAGMAWVSFFPPFGWLRSADWCYEQLLKRKIREAEKGKNGSFIIHL